jgi:hypothetical protein
MKAEYAGGAYAQKKRELLASLPQSSIGQKRNPGLKLNKRACSGPPPANCKSTFGSAHGRSEDLRIRVNHGSR